MGIHTGECDYDASDHLGLVVNQAARVRATAHGGQIVTSQGLGDIRLRPLGSYGARLR
jgi:class 3 adenylate cyclase